MNMRWTASARPVRSPVRLLLCIVFAGLGDSLPAAGPAAGPAARPSARAAKWWRWLRHRGACLSVAGTTTRHHDAAPRRGATMRLAANSVPQTHLRHWLAGPRGASPTPPSPPHSPSHTGGRYCRGSAAAACRVCRVSVRKGQGSAASPHTHIHARTQNTRTLTHGTFRGFRLQAGRDAARGHTLVFPQSPHRRLGSPAPHPSGHDRPSPLLPPPGSRLPPFGRSSPFELRQDLWRLFRVLSWPPSLHPATPACPSPRLRCSPPPPRGLGHTADFGPGRPALPFGVLQN